MHSIFVSAFFPLIAILTATSVMAQTTTTVPTNAVPTTVVPASGVPAGQSTANTSALEHFHFSMFSNFHGPNVNHLSSAETVNGNGVENPRQRMYFDTELTANYKLGTSGGVGVVFPFWYIPTKGGDFSIGDVGVRIYDRKAVATKDLSIGANLIVQAATNAGSRERGMSFALKTTPTIRYNVPETRFTLGAWTEAKAYFGVDAGKTFKLYAAPYVTYQLAPKFSALLEYEYEAGHLPSVSHSILDFVTVQHDILTGFIYAISPQLQINPYIAFYTTQKLSMQNAALGAIITASI